MLETFLKVNLKKRKVIKKKLTLSAVTKKEFFSSFFLKKNTNFQRNETKRKNGTNPKQKKSSHFGFSSVLQQTHEENNK